MPDATPLAGVIGNPRSGLVGASLPSGERYSWIDGRQLCAQVDPSLFHPGDEDDDDGQLTNPNAQFYAAQRVCRRCPLQAVCLRHALVHREAGTWGGTSEAWRHAARKRIAGDPRRLEAEVEAEMERVALTPTGSRRQRQQPLEPGETAA